MGTLADELAFRVRGEHAGTVVLAGLGQAGIVLELTIFTHVVPGAVANVTLRLVDADSSVLTWLRGALVHVQVTVLAWKN